MAEVQSRPSASRGRGSGRAGRGGHSSRGGRAAPRTASSQPTIPAVSLDEQGEIGQLKKEYATELETLRELFPDWTDDDLVFAMQETDGDLPRTIERISEGTVSQFSDVKKKTKEKVRTKKDVPVEIAQTSRSRTRGHDGARGGRVRATERGGRARAGRTGAVTNGNRAVSGNESVPTVEAGEWGASAASNVGAWEDAAASTSADTQASTAGAWGATPAADTTDQKSSLIPQGTKKSWASMLSQPKPVPAIPKVAKQPPADPVSVAANVESPLLASNGPVASEETNVQSISAEVTPTIPANVDNAAELTPPRDQLTEDNLEHLPDTSAPAPTETVASTRDPGSVVGSGTPYSSSLNVPATGRPPMGGYATTAWKAAGSPGRSVSFQRRMMEQREAVVMPDNHAVDRTAVQFGSLGLNGDKDLDIDDDREEAQTRAPVAQSPPSQPRTSLPPAPQQTAATDGLQGMPTPKQAPGLPMVSHNQPPGIGAAPSQISANQQSAQQGFGQYGRYGAGPGQDTTSKQHDGFGQQQGSYGQSQDTMYPQHSQALNASQTQTHGGYNQGPDYSSSFGNDQQRNNYQNYYAGAYGSSSQEHNTVPQRSGSALTGTDSAYASGQTASAQSRFGDGQNSGHTTPNPVSQNVGGQTHQLQGQAGHGQYHYGNPYYGNSYYGGGSYMNQYSNNYYNQQGYGGPYGGKGNMYGQPHHGYGISPQASYEQSASPANAGGFASNSRGNDSLSGGLGDYGRSGSTQPSQQNSLAGSYTGQGESFGRNTNYGGQGQQYGQGDDALKPFGGDNKNGSNPALSQPGRTGSAANSGYGGNPNAAPQNSQQGFGGYPSHLNQHNAHGSAYGGIGGGLGGHQGNAQGHQTGAYSGYGGFGNNYNYQRGGWSSNYGH